MYKFLTKNGQTLAFGLGVLITVVFLASVFSGLGAFSSLPEEDQASTSIFNFGISGAIVLAIIAAIAMVFFGLFQIFTNFRRSMKGIIGFGLLAAVFLVAYSVTSGDATAYIQGAIDKFEQAGNGQISAGNLKFIGGGITTVGVLLAVATLAFVISEIRNFFK